MSRLALDLETLLTKLGPDAAGKLERLVRDAMARAVEATPTRQAEMPPLRDTGGLPFSERIAGHAAIGSWPASVDVDAHIATLRDEWEG